MTSLPSHRKAQAELAQDNGPEPRPPRRRRRRRIKRVCCSMMGRRHVLPLLPLLQGRGEQRPQVAGQTVRRQLQVASRLDPRAAREWARQGPHAKVQACGGTPATAITPATPGEVEPPPRGGRHADHARRRPPRGLGHGELQGQRAGADPLTLELKALARRNEISPLVVLGGRRGQSTPPSPRPTAACASAAPWATRAGVLAGVLAHAPVFIDIAAGEYFFSGTRE